MFRSLLGLSLGFAMFLGAANARADEIKRALFILGIHMGGAEGVAVKFVGEPLDKHPGAIALMKRNLKWSIDVADTLKLPPSEDLKKLLADVDADKASFGDMAKRMADLRLAMQDSAAKTINPGAAAFFIMGVHESGGEGLAVGARDFARADKPGTAALIERQLTWLADGAPGVGLSLQSVLDIQDSFNKGATFADLAGQFEKLRLKWQDDLAAQPGFGAFAGGTVIFSTTGKLAATDPKDTVRKDMYAKVHVSAFKAGQTVIIDLESGDGDPKTKPGFFDTWLRLEDANGKELAFNDDAVPGKNYNSRVEYTFTQDGNYRIIVTSYRPGATGPYTVTVRQK